MRHDVALALRILGFRMVVQQQLDTRSTNMLDLADRPAIDEVGKTLAGMQSVVRRFQRRENPNLSGKRTTRDPRPNAMIRVGEHRSSSRRQMLDNLQLESCELGVG